MAGRAFTDHHGRWHIARHDGDTPTVHRVLDAIERKVADGTRFPPSEEVLASLIDSARRDDGRPSQKMMARLQILAQGCGLDRDDRMSLAHVMLGRDLTTWSQISQGEAVTLTNALEGFSFIAHLQAEQGRRWRYGRCPAEPCPMRDPAAAAAVLEGEPCHDVG